MLQLFTAFLTAFVYLIALFYSIQDIDKVFDTSIGYFPIAEIYLQATGSVPGAVGLIALLFLATFPTLIGTLTTGGRMWWSLARDNATPFASFFAQVHPTLNAPVNATCGMAAMVTCLGCIYVGSTTAFQALISSFIVLSTLSYAGAIVPHLLTGRKNIVPGPYVMPGIWGWFVNIAAVAYIAVTVVFFCFPFTLPVTVQNMNYTSVITVGLMAIVSFWWLVRGMTRYKGPIYSMEAAEKLAHGEDVVPESVQMKSELPSASVSASASREQQPLELQ